MKKNVIAIVIACFMTVGCLVSCSSDSSQNSGTAANAETTQPASIPTGKIDMKGRTITLASWGDPTPKQGVNEAMDRMYDRHRELEKEFNCKIAYKTVTQSEYLNTFVVKTMSGDNYDIWQMRAYFFYPGLVSFGYILPLSDYNTIDFKDSRWNSLVENQMVTYQGKVYGVRTDPLYPQSCVYFNKSLFERENLPSLYDLQNSGEWTFDKMREIAVKATKDTNNDGITDQWGITGTQNPAWHMVYSNGGYVAQMGSDGKVSFGLNSPNAIEALQYFYNLCNVDKVWEPIPQGKDWMYPIYTFKSGKVAMFMGKYWVASNWKNMKDDYGLVVMPKGPKSAEYVHDIDEGDFSVIPSCVKNPEEVVAFLSALNAPYEGVDPYEQWLDVLMLDAPLRDEESVNSLKLMYDSKQVINWWYGFWDAQRLLDADHNQGLHKDLQEGKVTPAAGVQKIETQAQAIFDDIGKNDPKVEIERAQDGQ